MGIYNCRPVRGGSTPSLHSEGRALDWGLNAYDGGQLAIGNRLKDFLIAQSASWGIQEVIWNRRYWSRRSGDIYYNGENAHTDHLHIGINWCGANSFDRSWASGAPGGGYGQCTVNGQRGNCKDQSQCRGTKTAGYCPGPANIQCCTPESAEIELTSSASTTLLNKVSGSNALVAVLGVAIAALAVAVVVLGVMVRRERLSQAEIIA